INSGAGDDVITGGAGINIIDGGEGIDTLVDANFSSATTDIILDDTDNVKNISAPDGTSISNIERFTNLTMGSGDDVISFTQRINNTINSGAGDDTISPGLGRDTVISGGGNDTVTVDTASDMIIELPNGGNDTIVSSVNYNLAALSQIENLRLTGTGDINGIGNRKDNVITGNSGQNRLTGLQGNDTFVFNFGDSQVDKPDQITDFQIGKDKIKINTLVGVVSTLTRAGNGSGNLRSLVDSVFLDANGAVSGNQSLGSNSAALIVSGGGTYLIVNDGTAEFNTGTDLVINITGYSGTLPGLGSITVSNFFL
ncbi:bluetail domain-containing putative surface protein, partial [Cylindrospermopsis raciborskii]|uniref:bluetail domain-containing putative surface protein n=1 Tax=Cylindrospermopsis raciborskii TaxID=77022 RepID=UPI0022C6AF78